MKEYKVKCFKKEAEEKFRSYKIPKVTEGRTPKITGDRDTIFEDKLKITRR